MIRSSFLKHAAFAQQKRETSGQVQKTQSGKAPSISCSSAPVSYTHLDYLAEMLLFAKPIAKAIEKTMDCNRCGITVMGLEVPHAHMHLIPINSANDLNFTQAKIAVTKEEMETIMQMIVSAL